MTTITYELTPGANYEVVGYTPPANPLIELEGIYGNRDWVFTLTFSGTDESGNQINITDISAETYQDILSSYGGGSSINLYKDPSALLFPGEQYRYVYFGSEEEQIYEDLTNLPDGLSIIAWDPPPVREITVSYTFEITYEDPTTGLEQVYTMTLDQDLFWDWRPGLIKLQEQVANSEY